MYYTETFNKTRLEMVILGVGVHYIFITDVTPCLFSFQEATKSAKSSTKSSKDVSPEISDEVCLSNVGVWFDDLCKDY